METRHPIWMEFLLFVAIVVAYAIVAWAALRLLDIANLGVRGVGFLDLLVTFCVALLALRIYSILRKSLPIVKEEV